MRTNGTGVTNVDAYGNSYTLIFQHTDLCANFLMEDIEKGADSSSTTMVLIAML